MYLRKAQRKNTPIKMALQGPSGSGKTYGALQVAFGLTGNWEKIAVIDSENNSADLYSHLGNYQVLQLSQPFTAERYLEAITVCEKEGMEVIIIDSITHEWENLLDYHGSLQGNSFTNWNKVTPRHNAFVQKLLQSPCHIISTMRTKQDYVLSEKNGKMVPEKVGLKSVQRDGLEYEFTLVFDLDIKNNAVVSKDRTGLFSGKPEQKLSTETGKQIKEWCLEGAEPNANDITHKILACQSINELLELYKTYPAFRELLKPEFEKQKRKILLQAPPMSEFNHPPIMQNGTH